METSLHPMFLRFSTSFHSERLRRCFLSHFVRVFSAPLVWAQTPCFFRTMRNHRVSHLVFGSNLNLLLRSFPKSALKMGNIRQSPSFARIPGTNMYVSSYLPIHTHTYIYIYIHKTYVRHVRDLRMSTFYTRSVHPFVYPGLSIQDLSYLVLSHTHIMYIYICIYIYMYPYPYMQLSYYRISSKYIVIYPYIFIWVTTLYIPLLFTSIAGIYVSSSSPKKFYLKLLIIIDP